MFFSIQGADVLSASETEGDQLHLTEYCRNFAKMNAIVTLRQYSGRYLKVGRTKKVAGWATLAEKRHHGFR
jgi:hypothetical protein